MGNLLKRIRVDGLHHRMRFDVDFFDDVNILYGRNGSGKTTLLHIIANVLNGSLERFAFLDFERIVVDFQDHRQLAIQRRYRSDNEREVIEIFVDDRHWGEYAVAAVTTTPLAPSANPLDQMFSNGPKYLPNFEELRSLLDLDGAAYFPAFRTMIDAWQSAARLGVDVPRGLGLPSPAPSPYMEYLRQHGLLSVLGNGTPNLTELARELFGHIVPPITYPTVAEIERDLQQRIAASIIQVQSGTFKSYSWIFLQALMPMVAPDELPKGSAHHLLLEIRSLLARLDDSEIVNAPENDRDMLRGLLDQVSERAKTNDVPVVSVELLTIYINTLRQQLQLQESEYAPYRRYLSSVNAFLEDKRLAILASKTSPVPTVKVEFDRGSTTELRVLSSGEQQIVSMLYAASTMESAGVVLIDEPELSLHLDWQRRLIGEMRSQLGNRQIIVCTHSPEIGADHEDKYQEVRPMQLAVAAD